MPAITSTAPSSMAMLTESREAISLEALLPEALLFEALLFEPLRLRKPE
jgi:hypothetical protein